MYKRILCLDVGDVRIGVAVSDPTRTIATPVEVIRRVGWGPDCRRIRELCDRYETDEVLSGLPLNMDGSEGFQAKKVREFCAQVERQGLKVQYQDERLTTVTAEEALLEDGMSRENRKQHVDKVAAAVILQQWLEEQRKKENQNEGGSEMADKMHNAGGSPEENMDEELDEELDEEMEDQDLIELVDEDGESHSFELLASFDFEGSHYIALADAEADDEEEDEDDEETFPEEVEVVLMKTMADAQGEDSYIMLDDEEEANRVFDYFMSLVDADRAEED